MFIIDTSILIAIEKKDHKIVEAFRKIREGNKQRVVISHITFCEYMYGIMKIKKSSEIERYYPVINTNLGICKLFVQIKINLEKIGVIIGDADIFIAAAAQCLGATLITKDKDFEKVPNLSVIVLP